MDVVAVNIKQCSQLPGADANMNTCLVCVCFLTTRVLSQLYLMVDPCMVRKEEYLSGWLTPITCTHTQTHNWSFCRAKTARPSAPHPTPPPFEGQLYIFWISEDFEYTCSLGYFLMTVVTPQPFLCNHPQNKHLIFNSLTGEQGRCGNHFWSRS